MISSVSLDNSNDVAKFFQPSVESIIAAVRRQLRNTIGIDAIHVSCDILHYLRILLLISTRLLSL